MERAVHSPFINLINPKTRDIEPSTIPGNVYREIPKSNNLNALCLYLRQLSIEPQWGALNLINKIS